MVSQSVKARYWSAVLYPENMIDNWDIEIGDILQIPYAYCVHDKDKDEDHFSRKTHLHLIIAFSNTTTLKNAKSVFERLAKPNKSAIALDKVENVVSVRGAYNYLIHDTETARKKKKYQYDPCDRVCGNGFDIGLFEQVSVAEKSERCRFLCDLIIEEKITNFADFYLAVMSLDDTVYFECIKSYSGLFERLTKAVYLKEFIPHK